MTDSGVPPSYEHGPHFLFESFAQFNELVLADYLAEHAAAPELKRYYLERWMSIKASTPSTAHRTRCWSRRSMMAWPLAPSATPTTSTVSH